MKRVTCKQGRNTLATSKSGMTFQHLRGDTKVKEHNSYKET